MGLDMLRHRGFWLPRSSSESVIQNWYRFPRTGGPSRSPKYRAPLAQEQSKVRNRKPTTRAEPKNVSPFQVKKTHAPAVPSAGQAPAKPAGPADLPVAQPRPPAQPGPVQLQRPENIYECSYPGCPIAVRPDVWLKYMDPQAANAKALEELDLHQNSAHQWPGIINRQPVKSVDASFPSPPPPPPHLEAKCPICLRSYTIFVPKKYLDDSKPKARAHEIYNDMLIEFKNMHMRDHPQYRPIDLQQFEDFFFEPESKANGVKRFAVLRKHTIEASNEPVRGCCDAAKADILGPDSTMSPLEKCNYHWNEVHGRAPIRNLKKAVLPYAFPTDWELAKDTACRIWDLRMQSNIFGLGPYIDLRKIRPQLFIIDPSCETSPRIGLPPPVDPRRTTHSPASAKAKGGTIDPTKGRPSLYHSHSRAAGLSDITETSSGYYAGTLSDESSSHVQEWLRRVAV